LSETRTALIKDDVVALHRTAKEDSRVVAKLSPQMVVELRDCPEQWCEVRVEGYRGYVKRSALWGLADDELLEDR